MKAYVVNASDLPPSGRWDARYHCLMAEHREAAEELAERYAAHELVKLATDLPFDQAAADAVFCQLHPHTRSSFLKTIGVQRDWKPGPDDDEDAKPPAPKPRRILEDVRFRKQLAAYCAAAAVHARARVMEELMALSRAKEALVRSLCTTAATAREKGAKHLVAAIAARKER